MSLARIATWAIGAFMMGLVIGAYLIMNRYDTFAYVILVSAYLVALAGIYKEKA
jgi:hypothetical protein